MTSEQMDPGAPPLSTDREMALVRHAFLCPIGAPAANRLWFMGGSWSLGHNAPEDAR
jgi:hypothetical protein